MIHVVMVRDMITYFKLGVLFSISLYTYRINLF
nr:MAG TPA: hypothetical protein [Bacteriophage sp.]